MEQQKGIWYQTELFPLGDLQNCVRHSETCETVRLTDEGKELQVIEAGGQERALVESNLMRVICSGENLRRAYTRVKQNKGAAGVDHIGVEDFADWFVKDGDNLIRSLREGTYYPSAVREVEIPKASGGVRKLGIPTVKDRVIQQAIAQVLIPIYEPTFSEHSYGFRPKRNAHQALKKASGYVEEGREIVVDIDLKTFFDVVNHDRLMQRLSTKIGDKILLKLIRRYLQSGIMSGGIVSQRLEGTPQGSPLSPLLSNIVLDELDEELEKRGHKFVRYADDCNIYVSSRKAGDRVMKSISKFIETKLKLIVNQDKSKVCEVQETKYLGYTIRKGGVLTVSKTNLDRFKDKIRKITKRNRGRSFKQIINELNPILRGWLEYFKYSQYKSLMREIDGWIRRKLRCYRIKQCKRVYTLYKFLVTLGVEIRNSWLLAKSGKGFWRKSVIPSTQQAMDNDWFVAQGLYSLETNYKRLTS